MSNRLKIIIGAYSIFLGVSVLLMWIMILSGETLSEGKTEVSFHLISEFLMALLCILGGLYLVRRRKAGSNLSLVAHAMVVYSVLNAAGYYGERGEAIMVLMFLVLLLLSLCSIIILIYSE